jgi:hypothetical protein
VNRVRYHPAAEEEVLSEISFLELRVPGLGRRFYGEVQRAEKLIAEFPESGYELLPGIRKCRLRKFPFSLIYSPETPGIFILAVAHNKRRPEYWARRMGS